MLHRSELTGLAATPGNPASHKGLRVVVRHPSLTTYAGMRLSPGQTFLLHGRDNDDRLLRLGFVEPLPKGSVTALCPVCGVQFGPRKDGPNAQRSRDGHAFKVHVSRDEPIVREARIEDVARINEESLVSGGAELDDDPAESKDTPPLYLDQTAAERGVKSETISL